MRSNDVPRVSARSCAWRIPSKARQRQTDSGLPDPSRPKTKYQKGSDARSDRAGERGQHLGYGRSAARRRLIAWRRGDRRFAQCRGDHAHLPRPRCLRLHDRGRGLGFVGGNGINAVAFVTRDADGRCLLRRSERRRHRDTRCRGGRWRRSSWRGRGGCGWSGCGRGGRGGGWRRLFGCELQHAVRRRRLIGRARLDTRPGDTGIYFVGKAHRLMMSLRSGGDGRSRPVLRAFCRRLVRALQARCFLIRRFRMLMRRA